MNKTRLQELCQSMRWDLPRYTTAREGPDHNPSFSATVSVNGTVYASPDASCSARGSQDKAAWAAIQQLSSTPVQSTTNTQVGTVAMEHLSCETPPPGAPVSLCCSPPWSVLPPPSSPAMVTTEQLPSAARSPSSTPPVHLSSHDGASYNDRLQNHLKGRDKSFPSCHSIQEGTSTSQFRSIVEVNGQTSGSEHRFPTIKEAEQSAAKFALISLSPQGNQQECPGFFKNLLQQLAQEEGFPLPKYTTTCYGKSHSLRFLSTVEIKGKHFQGDIAKTKKQAEMNAAQVALSDLKKADHALALCSSEPLLERQITNQRNKVIDVDNSYHHSVIPVDKYGPDITVNKINDADTPVHKPETVDVLNNEDTLRAAIPEYDNSVDSSDPDCSNLNNKTAPADLSTSIRDSLLLRNRVRIYPRNSDVVLPEGAVVLPCSDGDWVAVKVDF